MPNITTNHAITYTNYRQFKTIIAINLGVNNMNGRHFQSKASKQTAF